MSLGPFWVYLIIVGTSPYLRGNEVSKKWQKWGGDVRSSIKWWSDKRGDSIKQEETFDFFNCLKYKADIAILSLLAKLPLFNNVGFRAMPGV